jgi:hypothetical protein
MGAWHQDGLADWLSVDWHEKEFSGQIHVPSALPVGKFPLYQLDRRLDGL